MPSDDPPSSVVASLAQYAGASVVASFTSASVSHPFDVVKVLQQVQHTGSSSNVRYKGTFGTMKVVLAEDGLVGLYRGLGPTLFALVPSWGLFLAQYHYLRNTIATHTGRNQLDVPILAASVGSAWVSTAAVTSPIYVIKTRMQTQHGLARMGRPPAYMYKNSLDCLRHMWRHEGPSSLFHGLNAQLLGAFMVMIQYPLYEHLKLYHVRRLHDVDHMDDLPAHILFLDSIAAVIVAQALTYPYEVVRANMQISGATEQRIRPVVSTIVQREGYRGLYKGLFTNILRVIPANAISLSVFELVANHIDGILDWDVVEDM